MSPLVFLVCNFCDLDTDSQLNRRVDYVTAETCLINRLFSTNDLVQLASAELGL